MIKIPNIDGKIWQSEQHAIDIVDCVIAHQPLHIDLNGEGPDAAKLGLYSLLDNICARYNYPKQHVTITTCNQLEAHPEYRILKRAPLYIKSAQQFATQHRFRPKTFAQDFKHFGLFVGRSNWLRLWLASYLYNCHGTKTTLTFHYDPTLDFHQDHLGLDDLIRFRPDLVQELNPLQLIKHCPIVEQVVAKEAVDAVPVMVPVKLPTKLEAVTTPVTLILVAPILTAFIIPEEVKSRLSLAESSCI